MTSLNLLPQNLSSRPRAEGLFLNLKGSVHSPSYSRKSRGSQSNNTNIKKSHPSYEESNSFINNTAYHTPSRKCNLLFVKPLAIDTKSHNQRTYSPFGNAILQVKSTF